MVKTPGATDHRGTVRKNKLDPKVKAANKKETAAKRNRGKRHKRRDAIAAGSSRIDAWAVRPSLLKRTCGLDRTCGLYGCYVLAEYNSDDLDELGEFSPCGSSVQLDGLIRRRLSEPNTDQVDRPTRWFVSIDSAADGAGYGRRQDQSLRWICFRICFSSCA